MLRPLRVEALGFDPPIGYDELVARGFSPASLDTIVEHELPGELGARAILVYRAPGGQGR